MQIDAQRADGGVEVIVLGTEMLHQCEGLASIAEMVEQAGGDIAPHGFVLHPGVVAGAAGQHGQTAQLQGVEGIERQLLVGNKVFRHEEHPLQRYRKEGRVGLVLQHTLEDLHAVVVQKEERGGIAQARVDFDGLLPAAHAVEAGGAVAFGLVVQVASAKDAPAFQPQGVALLVAARTVEAFHGQQHIAVFVAATIGGRHGGDSVDGDAVGLVHAAAVVPRRAHLFAPLLVVFAPNKELQGGSVAGVQEAKAEGIAEGVALLHAEPVAEREVVERLTDGLQRHLATYGALPSEAVNLTATVVGFLKLGVVGQDTVEVEVVRGHQGAGAAGRRAEGGQQEEGAEGKGPATGRDTIGNRFLRFHRKCILKG